MPIGYYDSGLNCYIDSSTYSCTPLDAFGNGDYNGLTYSNGDPANGFYSSIPSSSYTNTYFISGSTTTLDSNGNGYWGMYYYVSGTQTSLDNCGNGSWNGNYYVDGAVSSSSYSSCALSWVYQGTSQSGLDSSGNGYSSTSTAYFLSGVQTTLDSVGSGFWDNHAYYTGSLQPTGYNGYYYYINDVQTTLDSSGNGTWNGGTYVSGVLQVLGTRYTGAAANGNWDDVANWTNDAGSVATALPDGNAPVTILSSPSSNMSNATTSFPGITVSGNFSLYFSMTMTNNGLALFKNGASLGANATIYGDAEFRDTAYLDSGGSVSGSVTFKGRAVNKNGITGAVTGAHGGGINGSNVLGFA